LYLTGAVKKSAVEQTMVISVDLGATEYNVNGQYVSNQAFTEVSLLTTSSTTICQLMVIPATQRAVGQKDSPCYQPIEQLIQKERKASIFFLGHSSDSFDVPRWNLLSGGEEHG
jgi:hypothetical protein